MTGIAGRQKGRHYNMKCQEIIERIERRFPREYACSWDNVGLLAGDRQQEVDTVYIALDATDEVIEAAVDVYKRQGMRQPCFMTVVFIMIKKNLSFSCSKM